ncbi:hypothetical protein Hanom_Chr15g01352721 [Helianthus anomalus]
MLSNVDRNIHTCTTANRPCCITTLYNSRRGPLMCDQTSHVKVFCSPLPLFSL